MKNSFVRTQDKGFRFVLLTNEDSVKIVKH